jgi:hypothetical protein
MRSFIVLVPTLAIALIPSQSTVAQTQINVRVNRALELQQLKGQVTVLRNGGAQGARPGDRLQSVGEGVRTGQKSSAALVLDSGIGQVNVAEQTQVKIREINLVSSGGRVTRLGVDKGSVRLQVRKFTNPDSRLEIYTPAGITGVRGTNFGVAVQPNGKMSVATLEGQVAASAQGQEVAIDAGFQNFTIPGEPPTPPVPITNNVDLKYRWVKRFDQRDRQLLLEGRVDPVNTVVVNEVVQNTDRNGNFSLIVPVTSFPNLRVTVITPLGIQKEYALAFR